MKKRKLTGNDANRTGQGLPVRSNGAEPESMNATWSSTTPIEASFSVPQRKKLLLQISSKTSEGIRALNPGTKEREFGIPWRDIGGILNYSSQRTLRLNICEQSMLSVSRSRRKPKPHTISASFLILPGERKGHPHTSLWYGPFQNLSQKRRKTESRTQDKR